MDHPDPPIISLEVLSVLHLCFTNEPLFPNLWNVTGELFLFEPSPGAVVASMITLSRLGYLDERWENVADAIDLSKRLADASSRKWVLHFEARLMTPLPGTALEGAI